MCGLAQALREARRQALTMRGLDVPGTTRARNRLSIRWDRSVKHVLGTRLSSSARVIRISILVQGGACGAAPGRCCCSRKPLARGMRPPAGPRAARGCTGAGDRHTRGQSQPTNKGMPSPGGQVSEMVGHGVCPPVGGGGVGCAPSRQPPRGLSRRRPGASLARRAPVSFACCPRAPA